MKNRGSVWVSVIYAVFVLAAVSVLYIILDQVYENTLYPYAIQKNVDADNLNIIDIAFRFWPIPVGISILWYMVTSARRGGYQYAYQE